MIKNYVQAPLPFEGQKRYFVKEFVKVLQTYDDYVTIIDLFGGSGLLSYISKKEKPNARIIYNDYDYYTERINNILKTNILLQDIRKIVSGYERGIQLPKNVKGEILQRVKQEENTGFVDWITLSSNLLFSAKYVTSYEQLSKEGIYNKICIKNYSAEGYLDGIEIVHDDYQNVYNQFKDISNVLFLVDPPYLSTDVKTYKMTWKLADYLNVLTILNDRPFVYFTSNKSSIIELCEWIGENKISHNPFANASKIFINKSLNYNSKYTDIMICLNQNIVGL